MVLSGTKDTPFETNIHLFIPYGKTSINFGQSKGLAAETTHQSPRHQVLPVGTVETFRTIPIVPGIYS
jgi:hypothetical protein